VWLAVPVRGKWRRQATKGVHLLQPKAGFVVLKPYSRLAGWEIQLIREILKSKNFHLLLPEQGQDRPTALLSYPTQKLHSSENGEWSFPYFLHNFPIRSGI
jgi:hypothetical protein